jgi:hypothetical protein
VFSFKKTKIKFIDTRFYITRKDIYFQYFVDSHSNLGSTNKESIEDVFLNVIINNGMGGVLFSTPPVVCGVGGGSGKYYKKGVVRIIKEKIRARIARSSSQYKKLFCR